VKYLSIKSLGGSLLVGLVACSSLAVWSQENHKDEIKSANDFAILIVGDESDGEMLRKEKVLIQEMAKSIRKQNKVPIYSYHFNKDREKVYCEKKLGILKEDLLFIGLVSLKDRVPRRVLYRLDRIVSPSRSSLDIVGRSDDMLASLGLLPGTEPSPPTTPANTTNTTNTTSSEAPEAGKWRVQLGVFTQQRSAQDLIDQLRAKGHEAKFDKSQNEGAFVFKVWVGNFATKEDAMQAVTELQTDGFEKGFAVENR
jgi:hypothetical protein